MCNGLIIFDGDTLTHEFRRIGELVNHFGIRKIQRCTWTRISDDILDCCLCPVDFEQLCTDLGYKMMPPNDARFSVFDTVIEKSR